MAGQKVMAFGNMKRTEPEGKCLSNQQCPIKILNPCPIALRLN